MDDSKCPRNFLCNFEKSRDLPDALVEICTFCSKKVIYRKGKKGRTDNKKYLSDHIRSTVQPFGKTAKLFKKIYGEKILQEFLMRTKGKKTKAQMQADWEEMRSDFRKRFRLQQIYR